MNLSEISNQPWIDHHQLMMELYGIGLQIMVDTQEKKNPNGNSWKRFNNLWEKFLLTGETLKKSPKPADKSILKKLEETHHKLTALLNSLGNLIHVEKNEIGDTLCRMRMVKAGQGRRPSPLARRLQVTI